jgi:hypothetical protein
MDDETSFNPAVRAQMLATEHWSLLATRSQTWSEVMGRITAQFTFASAVLVVLALGVQQMGYGSDFRWLAAGLGLAVLLTGTLTAIRVGNASQEDYLLVLGMNRLRRAYVDLDPGIADYLVTGSSDDAAGMTRSYTMGPERDVGQLLASAWVFILSVNTLVAGGLVGLLVRPWGTSEAIGSGILAALAYVITCALVASRQFRYNLDPALVRFPSQPDSTYPPESSYESSSYEVPDESYEPRSYEVPDERYEPGP